MLGKIFSMEHKKHMLKRRILNKSEAASLLNS
jgi:hypothetical protein